MKYVAIDCETWLDTMTHPKYGVMQRPPLPVCISFAFEDRPPLLLRRGKKAKQLLLTLFKSKQVTLVFQNNGFDISVFTEWMGIPHELVYREFAAGRIKDTMVRELLIGVATGDIKHPQWRVSLDALTFRYKGIDKSHLKKGDDIWRLRYNELDGVPIKDYPEDASTYAIGDPVDTLDVFFAQFEPEDLFSQDENFQTQSLYMLWWIGCRSPYVDAEEVKRFASKHTRIVKKIQKPFIAAGFLKPNPHRHKQYEKGDPKRAGFSEVKARFQAAVEKDYKAQGRPVPTTDPTSKFPEGQIKTSQEALLGCTSRALRKYGEAAQDIKLVNAFVPMLEQNAGRRVMPMYNVIVSTGRTSCVKADTPVLVKPALSFTNTDTTPRYKYIYQVCIGDEVWTHKQRWRRVTGTMVREAQPMYKLEFCNGKKLVCTAEHRLLTSDNDWVLVGDFINEHLTFVGSEQTEPESSQSSVQEGSKGETSTRSEGHSEGARDRRTQRNGSGSNNIHPRGTQDVQVSIFSDKQDRLTEPDAHTQGVPAPELCRGLRRWVRLQDSLVAREEGIHSSSNIHGEPGAVYVTEEHGCTSYRREQTQQRVRQPSFMYQEGPQENREFATTCLQTTDITVASDAGLYEVHDIQVDEDESYCSDGILSHNCRLPNMQQLPRAPGARECFVPPEGKIIACLDYDSFEMFGLAQVLKWDFNETKLLETLNAQFDPHLMVAATLTGNNYQEVDSLYRTKDPFIQKVRQLCKIVNFGAAGGMGPDTFLSNMDQEVRDTMTILNPDKPLNEVMRDILLDWRDVWGMDPYFKDISRKTRGGKQFDYVHHWSGRRRGDVGYTDGCNLPFQGICADGAKNAGIQLVQESLTPGMYLHEKQVEIAGFFHDEYMGMGPPDTVRKWTGRMASIMVSRAQEVMPDCEIRVGVEICGSRWSKSGMSVEEFEKSLRENN